MFRSLEEPLSTSCIHLQETRARVVLAAPRQHQSIYVCQHRAVLRKTLVIAPSCTDVMADP